MGEPTTKPGHVCGRSSWALFFFFFLNYSLTKGKASASLIFIALGLSFPQPLSKALL